MRTKRANIDDFMNRTKTDLLSGYRKQVDFIESTFFELSLCYNPKRVLGRNFLLEIKTSLRFVTFHV